MQKNQNSKLVAVAMTPKQAELLAQKNGKELVVVFPGTPVSRQILFMFMRGNTVFRRLADAMVWGQVSAEDYSKLTTQIGDALKKVDNILKEAGNKLKAVDSAKKGHGKKAEVKGNAV